MSSPSPNGSCRTPYFLRPRDKTSFRYFEKIDDDDLDDDDYHEEVVLTFKKPFRKPSPEIKSEHPKNCDLNPIPFPVNNFDDLIKLSEICTNENMYKDCQLLPRIKPVLDEINNLIGLKSIKHTLCSMILFELKHISNENHNRDYYKHMVITGQPGLGKTNLAKLIAKLYNKLGCCDSDEITEGHAQNLISK